MFDKLTLLLHLSNWHHIKVKSKGQDELMVWNFFWQKIIDRIKSVWIKNILPYHEFPIHRALRVFWKQKSIKKVYV